MKNVIAVVLLLVLLALLGRCSPNYYTASTKQVTPRQPRWTQEDRMVGSWFVLGGFGFAFYLNPNWPN